MKIGVGHASVGELEKKYVNEALDAGRLSPGEFVYKFEREFARLHNQKYGVACNSGTSALHVALVALKEARAWPDNAEVIVPAITFIATPNSCIHSGLQPIFVDVLPDTYNIDVEDVKRKITANTVAIIPVHTFGQPCDMDEIMAVAKEHKLAVIEDCAESHFALYRGRPAGSFGDMSCFSTYVAHTITTGIGGVVTTNDSYLAELSRSLVAHGRACVCEVCIASIPDQVCRKRLGTEIDRRFMMERIGFSYRIGELEGALGMAQLENRDMIMTKRKENATLLTQLLEPHTNYLQLPRYPEYIEHSFMMYPIVVKKEAPFSRNAMVEYLESKNIETRPMLPLLNQPIYKKIFGNIEHLFPVAEWIDKNGFYVGCHHGLDKGEIKYIADNISKFLRDFTG